MVSKLGQYVQGFGTIPAWEGNLEIPCSRDEQENSHDVNDD